MSKKERPGILMRKTKNGLAPISSFDEERIASIPLDTEFELVPRSKRSHPHMRLYWQALSRVVEATDIAPSPDHLHALVKDDLGYVVPVRTLSGKREYWPDSIAFDAMSQEEFNVFFTRAMARLAEVTGCDPLQFLTEQAA